LSWDGRPQVCHKEKMKRVSDSPTAAPARPSARRTKKTKYSFLRWLHKRNALKERTAAPDKKKEKDALPLSKELMSWVDDGGSVAQETPTG
jgi:hypothetical protein